MSSWFTSFGTLHHGFGGRFKLGSLAPAEEFDEAVTKGQLSEFDGPISFDFTDTLDFLSGSIDKESDPEAEARLIGDFIGYSIVDGDLEGLSGVFDGLFSAFGGAVELPVNAFLNQLIDTDTKAYVTQGIREIDLTPLGSPRIGMIASTTVNDGNENILGTEITTSRDGTRLGMEVYKDADTGFVSFNTNENKVGFEVACELTDVDDTYLSLMSDEAEGADVQLGFTGRNIFSQTLLTKDFANDAAAAAGDVPEGGFYHTAGVLKIRLPLP